jgi:putative glycosyltransferase (TIGR04372 family)
VNANVDADRLEQRCFDAAALLRRTGDLEEVLRRLRRARRERARPLANGKPRYRYLAADWAADLETLAGIAHLAMREQLLGRDAKDLILDLLALHTVPNRPLLEKLGELVTVASTESALPCPRDHLLSVTEDVLLWESLDGLTKHRWHACAEIVAAWERAGRGPLLALTAEESAAGRAQLAQLGLPAGAWFACVHTGDTGSPTLPDLGPAIRSTVARGGWVVLMGDSAATRPSPAPLVIDYTSSAARSETMDLYLFAACRFFVGAALGPAQVPPLFGVPCALVDWAPGGMRPYSARDLYLPRLWRAGAPEHFLGLPETMAPPLGFAAGYAHERALGLTPLHSTSAEIAELVDEMLDRVEGSSTCVERDALLLAAFDAVAETNLCRGAARPGRAFLRRYARLLTGTAMSGKSSFSD